MADTVFPVTDQVVTRDILREWVSGVVSLTSFVASGYAVTDGGGLTIDIALGVAHSGGVYLERDAATTGVVVSASSTNHVWVAVDESDTAGAVEFVVNTSGTPPSQPAVKLAEVTTDGSSVTGITDKRNNAWFSVAPVLGNTQKLRGETATIGTLRSLIGVAVGGEIEVGEAGVALSLLGSALTFGGTAVVLTDDARLTDERTPLDDSVSAAKIVDAVITDAKIAAANKDGAAGTPSMRTLGSDATQACAGDDSRLSDSRTPTSHASSHEPGGGDAMAVDAAQATGSLRTLGSGSKQASPGNHDHDADYAALVHDHDSDYAALVHEHSEYPDTGTTGKDIRWGTDTEAASSRTIATGLTTIESVQLTTETGSARHAVIESISGGTVTYKVYDSGGTADAGSIKTHWFAVGTA